MLVLVENEQKVERSCAWSGHLHSLITAACRRTFKLYCAVLMHTTDPKTKANYGW